jgi:hypothetical protein
MDRLNNERALVAGGASGIGLETGSSIKSMPAVATFRTR